MTQHPQSELLSIKTPALELAWMLVPWDTDIVGAPVAQITDVHVHHLAQARHDCAEFFTWCAREGVALSACRLPSTRINESMLLEEFGFRFIELNYSPRLVGLQGKVFPGNDVRIEPACSSDRETLAAMAAEAFPFGRFHQDPRIDSKLGDRRYRIWLENAFINSRQSVLKCLLADAIVGFFVVESPEPAQRFWSLTALAPGLGGKGLGKRVWQSVLQLHQSEGVDAISTSISSHNIPVFNLYVSLGFRFPQPSITLHWRPPDAGILQ